jgi:CTP:phosphocholine cytidylyltransferase-like protein
MVVEAVSLLGNRPKIGNIKILSVTGPSMEATEFIKGFAMKNMVTLVHDYRIFIEFWFVFAGWTRMPKENSKRKNFTVQNEFRTTGRRFRRYF